MVKRRSTSTQVWTFIVITSLILLVVSSQWGGRFGLFAGLLFSLVLNGLLFIWGDGLLLRKLALEPIKGQDPWGFNLKIDKWVEQGLLILPQKLELFILKTNLPTAFSFEFPFGRPVLALSEGLFETLSLEEVEMVLIHQLCQLQHRQNLRFAILSLLANTVAQLSLFMDRIWIPNSIFGQQQRPFLTICSPLISLLVRLSHSAQDQFVIDQHAAQLINSREKLGRLLWKLESWSLTRPMDILPATSHLFIVNPERIRQKNSLLQFHPSTKARLEKLVGAFPV